MAKHLVPAINWETPSCEALAAFSRARNKGPGVHLPRHRQLVTGDLVTFNQSNKSFEMVVGKTFPAKGMVRLDVNDVSVYARNDECELIIPIAERWVF